MAAKKKAAKAGAAAVAAKNSPYVKRVIEDEGLRDNIVQAFESGRSAYARLSDGKTPATKQIFDDKKLQRDFQQAASAFKEASVGLREAPKAKRGGGILRKFLLVVVVAGGALAASEGLRKKALDALFGAEEEFEYTSATTAPPPGPTPPTPAPTPPAPSETVTPASGLAGGPDSPATP